MDFKAKIASISLSPQKSNRKHLFRACMRTLWALFGNVFCRIYVYTYSNTFFGQGKVEDNAEVLIKKVTCSVRSKAPQIPVARNIDSTAGKCLCQLTRTVLYLSKGEVASPSVYWSIKKEFTGIFCFPFSSHLGFLITKIKNTSFTTPDHTHKTSTSCPFLGLAALFLSCFCRVQRRGGNTNANDRLRRKQRRSRTRQRQQQQQQLLHSSFPFSLLRVLVYQVQARTYTCVGRFSHSRARWTDGRSRFWICCWEGGRLAKCC